MSGREQAGPLLLLLLGGRIQPAVMALQHFRPAVIGCIVSADTPERAEAVVRLAEQSLPGCRVLTPEIVPPYEPLATRTAIARLMEQTAARPVLISLTGGSMPMVLGGYEMARMHGWPAYYQDTASGQLLDLAAEQGVVRIDLRPSIVEYLAMHDARLNPTKVHPVGPAPNALQVRALALLAQRPTVTAELLAWLFAGQKSSTTGLRNLQWRLSDAERTLLHELAALGLLRDLAWRANGERVQLRVASGENLTFLNGHWLEQYVYRVAQTATHEDAPLFDECAHSLHFLSGGAPRELDFVAVRCGRLMTGSCKTSKNPWDKQALDELVAVTKNLGDNFTIRLFVTNQMRPATGHRLARSFAEFAAQAQKARIRIISGDDLPDLQTILCREAITPSYPWN